MSHADTSKGAEAPKRARRTPPPSPNPEVFSLMEFCQWARISRAMAFVEIKAGRLKVRRFGAKSLITLDAARAWLNALPTSRSA
jgi:hypothetical protein